MCTDVGHSLSLFADSAMLMCIDAFTELCVAHRITLLLRCSGRKGTVLRWTPGHSAASCKCRLSALPSLPTFLQFPFTLSAAVFCFVLCLQLLCHNGRDKLIAIFVC